MSENKELTPEKRKIKGTDISKKLSFLLIAFGLLLGGIVGISQAPPATSAQGWSNQLDPYDIEMIPIPDQNGDGVEDIFVWANPKLIEHSDSTVHGLDWNLTTGLIIVNGATGSYLAYETLDEKYYHENGWGIAVAVPELQSIIITVNTIKNISGISDYGSNWDAIDHENMRLLRISLENIGNNINPIAYDKNVTDEGWEPSDGFSVDGQFYMMEDSIHYLKNMGTTSSRMTEYGVIAWKSSLPFFKDGSTTELNDTKSKLTFIDPNTLTFMDDVIFDIGPLNTHDYTQWWGFCDGPNTLIERDHKYPYFILTGYNYSASLTEYELFIADLDDIGSYNETIWMHNNTHIFNFNFNGDHEMDTECVLSLNSTGYPSGITVLLQKRAEFNTTYDYDQVDEYNEMVGAQEGDTDAYNSFFRWAVKDERFYGVVGSVVASYYFNETDIIKTMLYLNRIGEAFYPGSIYGITHIEGEPLIYDIVPITLGTGDKQTSIALVGGSAQYTTLEFGDGLLYFLTNISIIFMSEIGSGTSLGDINVGDLPGTYNQDYNIISSIERAEFVVNFDDYQTREMLDMISIEYDIDNDNKTDIPILGTWVPITEDSLENSDFPLDRIVNGPYFNILQNGSGNFATQHIFQTLTITWIEAMMPFTDVNNDTISDVFMGNIMIFASFNQDEENNKSYWDLKFEDKSTRILFIMGSILLVVGVIIILFVFITMREVSIKVKVLRKKRTLIMIIIAFFLIAILYMNLLAVLTSISTGNSQIGQTPEAIAIANITRISGWANFTFFTVLPVTIGLFILLSPMTADSIVGFNQIYFAKRLGIKAAMKREEINESEMMKSMSLRYKIVILPPFGKEQSNIRLITRVMSIVTLAVTVGLYAFNYGSPILFPELIGVTSFTSITDTIFIKYVTAVILLLIIPGLVAIPFFFWLYPAPWLLDDSGVLFYIKSIKDRRTEDVESIGNWFSSYLKGFLGISALVSYLMFIFNSPLVASTSVIGGIGPVSSFVFLFLVLAGISIGLLTIAVLDIFLPFNANRLYRKLEKRGVSIERKSILFGVHEKLDEDVTVKNFQLRFGEYKEAESIEISGKDLSMENINRPNDLVTEKNTKNNELQ